MNADQLKAYKREKSRLFNAKMRDLRLRDKEKKQTADQQPDNTIDKQDELSLQDVMDIFETLDTKLDLLESKLETKLENKIDELLNNVDRLLDIKLDELFNRLDIIESIIENKLENKMETKLETIMENKLYEPLETKQPINRLPSIFFA